MGGGFIFKLLIKLVLNLLILVGLVSLIKYSYQLFTTHGEPLKGAIILIAGLALWVAIIKLSKSRSRHYWLRYKATKPSFKLTTLVVALILVIFTFAGVQPFASYKNGLVEKWGIYQVEQAVKQAEREAEETRVSKPEITNPDEVDIPIVLPHPQGVYMGTGLYQGFVLDFEDNRLTMVTGYGKSIYRYEIIKDGSALSVIDVITGNENVWEYKYLVEEDCVVLIGEGYDNDDVIFWGDNPKTGTSGEKPSGVSVGEDEKRTFALLNQERIKVGLPCITWDYQLHRGARDWSEHMQTVGKLYHDTSGNFAECCYGASWSNYRTPEQTVEAWMTSSGHRAILLGGYGYGAIGIAKDSGFFATYRCQ